MADLKMPRSLPLESHTLVIDRSKAELLPALRHLLRTAPQILVVLDRRLGERRQGDRRKPRLVVRGRDRRTTDRRQVAAVLHLA